MEEGAAPTAQVVAAAWIGGVARDGWVRRGTAATTRGQRAEMAGCDADGGGGSGMGRTGTARPYAVGDGSWVHGLVISATTGRHDLGQKRWVTDLSTSLTAARAMVMPAVSRCLEHWEVIDLSIDFFVLMSRGSWLD